MAKYTMHNIKFWIRRHRDRWGDMRVDFDYLDRHEGGRKGDHTLQKTLIAGIKSGELTYTHKRFKNRGGFNYTR